ncbi:gp436 family protein [Desulfonatronovibrio hydrogenovorans]|uniref:gp436 family protein n=1 Tax=Desulfonatronovibrio hydrogenovorans TaxID=53245 RepID=UPI00048B6682|nr:DUF1320 domain-containing protein [Desulfonatronovibrio hydrogenovorans]
MPYCTVQDLIKRFGESEMIELTDREHSGEVDHDVAQRALDDAAAEVDGYLGSRYSLPLSEPPAVLSRVTADIARFRLHDTLATEEVRKRYEDARQFLEHVARGKISLGVTPPPETSTGSPRVRKGVRVFGSEDMEGF